MATTAQWEPGAEMHSEGRKAPGATRSVEVMGA